MSQFPQVAMSTFVAVLVLLARYEVRGQGLKLFPEDLVGDQGITSAPAHSAFGGGGEPVIHKMSWKDSVPSKVGDQGSDYSCVGWTLGYGLLSAITGNRDTPYSPYYVYRWGLEYTAEKEDKIEKRKPITPHNGTQRDWPRVSGIDFWAGFLVFTAEGCCSLGRPKAEVISNTIHFENLSQDIISEGHASRVFVTPDRMDQNNIVANIKAELTSTWVNGKPGAPHPVPCGFNIHRGLRDNVGLEKVPNIEKPCLWAKDCSNGDRILHAMLIVGYDDDLIDKGKGAFEVMNSFGDQCANNGFLWIAYDLMAQTGPDANDRSKSPCCVAAWRYIVRKPVDSLAKGFGSGTDPGWVRLQDPQQQFNFATPNGPISAVTDLHKGDELLANFSVAVRAAYKAVGHTATSAGQQIGKLKQGDSVIIDDYHVLTRGDKKEIWAKVRIK